MSFGRLVYLFALVVAVSAVPPKCTLSNVLTKSDVPDSLICPFIWATGLNSPRGVITASNNDLLVVESGFGRITALWDADNSGTSNSSERVVLATQSGLNHGIAIHNAGGYLYASTQTDVYRWKYTAGQRQNLGAAEHIIANLPCCHHTTRTLRFSPDETDLYVQSGSGANVDPDPTHAEIRRFQVSRLTALTNWSSGELFAYGLRNEVGLRFDPSGNAWGVENGVDDVERPDWNLGDIHNDNPCEEVNLFRTPGAFYGYPYCWSEGILPSPPGMGPTTQWVHEDFQSTAPYSDTWCQNPQNVVKPAHCLPAHNAPLDIIFGSITPDGSKYNQTAYVSSHGSWDRNPADGYKIWALQWNTDGTITHSSFLQYEGPGATGTGWPRPVGLAFIKCPWADCLMISSDSNNNILGVAYNV